MRKAVASVLALVLAAFFFQAAEAAEEPTAAELKEYGEHFGRCAGLWQLFAEVDTINGKSASAEQTHNLENGALTASAWAFAVRYQKLNPTLAPKPIREFMGRAKSLRDLERTRLLALFEGGAGEDTQRQVQLCQSLREAQQKIIDDLRDERERME